eukprot:CAMPEP_0206328860 /NCGR_PEP_ID=MMETSP0106_2-20121207/22896_1 /ASSEMBLY_ACC=CAM_ASM_000206 /TAXON_ID=81532 /ORGANISM="Acanthoeca-like sp., Strain 10tr" /LENGTH=43 /DNA_ID= /DNA_START= /DNA_END= /DNA_ORIENTATION=
MRGVFERIVAGKLELPSTIDPMAADLIHRMLESDMAARISLAD